MSKLDRIYASLPLSLQNQAVSIYGIYWHWLRFGGRYKTHESDYRNRDHYTAAQWAEYQQAQCKKLILLASEKVPYYQRTWTHDQVQAALKGDLAALPLLEKDPIRKNPLEFVRSDMLKTRHYTNYTSGSTGTPIATLWTADEIRDSLAVREVRSANWAGVSFKQHRATFSGRMVEPDPESKGPFYRYNAAEKQVYFSAFHLRPDTAHFYVEALKKHAVEWMTGYAVSFYLLAKFILQKRLDVPPLKAIITTSEKVTPEMRSVMEQAYHCKVYEEYSTVENALFASECEHGRLHVSPDVGIVEILRPDGSPCDPGEAGEVVTTCLMRTFQPMIRYRLGDLATWDPEPCPCGRSMPVIKEVVGRIEDVVIGPDGRQMVRFHGIFVNQPHIVEGQIIQESLDHIHVKLVPSEGYGELDNQEIIHRVQQRLGPSVSVTVECVSSIPRTKAGKFKAVISNIKP
jgi:phenylacetate-CoA ligase